MKLTLKRSGDGKRAFLSVGDDLRMEIDTDDVDTLSVASLIEKLMVVLVSHWDEPMFAHYDPEEFPKDADGDYWEDRYERGVAKLEQLCKKGNK